MIDMDGVLSDIYYQFQKYEMEESGRVINLEDIEGLLELDAFPNGLKHVSSEGFFSTAPIIEGSVEALKYLSERYSILIVSSATEYPNSMKEKVEWLNRYFPFISWRQMIFCGDKSSIRGDIMIDDHPKNLDLFEGEKIMFTQPHNANIVTGSYRRVVNWSEILEIL